MDQGLKFEVLVVGLTPHSLREQHAELAKLYSEGWRLIGLNHNIGVLERPTPSVPPANQSSSLVTEQPPKKAVPGPPIKFRR